MQTILFKEFPRLSGGHSHLELISLIWVPWQNDKMSTFNHESPRLTVWVTNTWKIHIEPVPIEIPSTTRVKIQSSTRALRSVV